jgi:hypothetical protein
MLNRRLGVLLGVPIVLATAAGAFAVAFTGGSGQRPLRHELGKFAVAEPDAANSKVDGPGTGPTAYEGYLSAEKSYPATFIPPAIAQHAEATFSRIAAEGGSGGSADWTQLGPKQNALEPGVLAFSGANNTTASRITAMVIAPTCVPGNCRLYVGASGGGIWRTDNALATNPSWQQVTENLAQNSVGSLTLDPNDPSGRTVYLGTGEANRCSSGCEAGVGIYRSKNGGESWRKLADSCVSNSTYACVSPGVDSFLGRGISKLVVDPTNPSHIFVGSALGVRGLSHVIGNGGTTRFEPAANNVGLYESNDGGATFTEVWNGNGALYGVIDVGLDPLHPTTVYASAFDQGLWRRSPALDGSSTPYDFHQVFAPQYPGGNTDRTMFAATVKAGKTRLYLTDGTANPGTMPANFWRTDNSNQPAATLLASQAAGATPPLATTVGPQYYNGWQNLTAPATSSPYYATNDFCTGQCWYDEAVYTPAGMPDTVYVIGSYGYGEIPCNTKGVGCGNGRSNGRAVVYSTTAGDPQPVTTSDGTTTTRTFTDLTFDAQNQPAPWCSLDGAELTFGGVTPPYQCLWAPDSIHPDQHTIVVNPNNPTQIFEGSDGGVVRTNGTFADISSHCNSGERPLLGGASLNNCKRLLSRVPNVIDHINKTLSSTLQFVGVSLNPSKPCEVQGGTQDNGTWSNIGCDNKTWPQIIYGDGGNSGYDSTQSTWRFNEFTSGFSDSNFENGAPTKWVITSAPIVNSGEAVAFYWPQIGDPNPPAGAHPIFSGAQHVWRTWAFGAGTPGAVPQDTTPNIAFYEANCQEFITFGGAPSCGDYQPLGGPQGSNTAGDLTGSAYGADRTGGSISWLTRDKSDHGTLWAATSAGRIFVTHNADASDPATVSWHRIDDSLAGNSPTRFPSGIYVDPANSSHAWISYSGYNASTPTTPGHVFNVLEGGAAPGSGVFTNLNVESGTSTFPTPDSSGDLPVSDVVRDDATHTLYVGTDFGVLRGAANGTRGWRVLNGLPRYEIMHLEITPSSRVATCVGVKKSKCDSVLYAATHSQGIWSLDLGEQHGN